MILLLFLFVILMHGANSQEFAIPFVQPSSCLDTAQTQYFDFGTLSCKTCEISNTVSTDYSCQCAPGYKADISNIRVLSCEICPGGATTPDGYFCTSCSDTEANGQCTCNDAAQHVTVNFTSLSVNSNATSTCEICPGLQVSTGDQSCAFCPECCTNSTNVKIGDLCFDATTADDLNNNIPIIPSDSVFISSNALSAYGACVAQPSMRNQTACEQLANMCVKEHYNIQNAYACSLYTRVVGSTPPYIDSGTAWQTEGIPWLYYDQNSNEQIQFDVDIATSFPFDASTKLELFVAQYRANGTFLGISSVEDGLIQLCKDKPSVMNAAYVFGTTFESSCSLDAKSLFRDENNANIYYDMFLQITSAAGTTLYPVPVLVDNYSDDSGSNSANLQFVRRFFLIDNIDSPLRAQYAISMQLSIRIQSSDGSGTIYPPILRMSYIDVSTDVLIDEAINPTVDASFTVTYSSDVTDQNEGIKISLSIFGVLAFLFAAVETSGWRRRQGLPYVEITSLIQFILFFMGNLANVFLVVTLGYATVLLIFFKGQVTANSYTPSNGSYQNYLYIVFIGTAFACKFVEVLVMIFQQSSIDIFLIDWERPRAKSAEDAKISVWRTFFIANEWNEIQTCRKINTTFQLFTVLLFLEVIGFKNLALLDSSSELNPSANEYTPPSSNLLRFGIGGIVYVTVALVQVIYFKLIHERFIGYKVRDFVDLCSVSNISVFILAQQNFGYYIHGRSVHGRADTDMAEMKKLMQRESNGPVTSRGLEPGQDDQVFEMMIPVKMRQHYDKIYQPLQLMKALPAARGGNNAEDNLTNESMKAYKLMRLFLSSFIDHSIRDMDYEIRDKLFLEKLFNIELQESIDIAHLVNDDEYSFANILFYGREIALLVFDILLFSLIDYGATDFVLAAIITYMVGGVFKILRGTLGRYNLARKTLIDKRFLI